MKKITVLRRNLIENLCETSACARHLPNRKFLRSSSYESFEIGFLVALHLPEVESLDAFIG